MIPKEIRTVVCLLVIGTFLAYLAVGLYYILGPSSPFPWMKLSLGGDKFLTSYPSWNYPQEYDDAAYNRVALEVLKTGLPQDKHGAYFFHAPVYGYFIALCYALGGLRIAAVVIPQALVAALTCGAITITAYNIAPLARFRAALIAGFLFLINLRLAMYVGYVSPTILLEFFFSLALVAASQQFNGWRLSLFVTACVLAIGTQAAFFIVGLAAAGWLMSRAVIDRSRAVAIAAIVLLCLAGTKALLPRFVSGSSKSSSKAAADGILWEANNPYYESMTLTSLWERRPNNPWTKWKVSEQEQQRYNEYLNRGNQNPMTAAILWIRENPVQYAKLTAIRLWTTLGPLTGMMSPRNRAISTILWLLTFPAGCYGWWIARRNPLSQLALVATATLTIFSALVIVEWYLRYRFPIDVLMTVYAGIAYAHWSSIFLSRHTVERP